MLAGGWTLVSENLIFAVAEHNLPEVLQDGSIPELANNCQPFPVVCKYVSFPDSLRKDSVSNRFMGS